MGLGGGVGQQGCKDDMSPLCNMLYFDYSVTGVVFTINVSHLPS